MHRCVVDAPLLEGDSITLNKEESAHCAKVLRLRSGDSVQLLDGENLHMGTLETVGDGGCTVRVGDSFVSVDGQRPPELCESAWDSVAPFVRELAAGGGNFYDGWMKNPYSAMISCNDGFRPVSFYLEREDDTDDCTAQ